MDTRIRDIAHDLLDNLTSGLEAAGVEVPARSYTHSGLIAHDYLADDCNEQFVVSWMGFLTTGGMGTIVKCAVPFIGRFVVALLRCVPTLTEDAEAPTADELTAAADLINTDAMTLAAVAVDKQL